MAEYEINLTGDQVKGLLTSDDGFPVAIRTRNILRQIAMEHELDIISGKINERSYSYVHRLSTDA